MRRFWVLLGAAACAPEPDGCPVEGVGRDWACGSPWAVELGVGETAWAPLDEAETLPLVRGNQGLQHVEIAARLDLDAADLPIDRAMVTLGAWAVDDGAVVVPEDTWGATILVGEAPPTLVGLRLVVADPDPFVGRRIGVGLSVAPVGYGSVGTGWVEGVLTWADD